MARSTRAGVEVEGGPQLRRAFKKMGARASDLRRVNADVGQVVLDRADTLVPRLSGELAATGRVEAGVGGARVTYGTIYAPPIMFGWRDRNIEPHPWLTDALDDTRAEVVARYEREVDSLVRRLDAEAP